LERFQLLIFWKKFTFEIGSDGGVNFLGKGDLHDAEYDKLKVDSNYETMHQYCHYGFTNFYEKFSSGRRRDLQRSSEIPIIPLGPIETGFDSTGNHTIHYRIHVYPSQMFQEKYVNHEPRLLAIAVAAIFFFTASIFLLYDRIVEKRQNRTMEAAVLANRVVNSQFPAIVRERIFENVKRNKEMRCRANLSTNLDKTEFGRKTSDERSDCFAVTESSHWHNSRLSSFLNKHTKVNKAVQENEEKDCDEEDPFLPPIADIFPQTTILFADIVGFTAWSSAREPTQVFQLLVSEIVMYIHNLIAFCTS
jgi:hypothetical protein